MPVIMRAAVELQPGCPLLYLCPIGGDDYRSQQFFDKHRGKFATFIRYGEKSIGPLDYDGRLPGRYLDHDCIIAQFVESQEVLRLNILHFAIVDPEQRYTRFTALPKRYERLGDLTYPILFYQGDTVRFKQKPHERVSDEPHQVGCVYIDSPFTEENIPRYEVRETVGEAKDRQERTAEASARLPRVEALCGPTGERQSWNVTHDHIELDRRGNVWALYENPGALSFADDKQESAFWGMRGISTHASDVGDFKGGKRRTGTTSRIGVLLEDAWFMFTSGAADVINPLQTLKRKDEPTEYEVRRLHDCWEVHRERVRSLTRRLWDDQVKDFAA